MGIRGRRSRRRGVLWKDCCETRLQPAGEDLGCRIRVRLGNRADRQARLQGGLVAGALIGLGDQLPKPVLQARAFPEQAQQAAPLLADRDVPVAAVPFGPDIALRETGQQDVQARAGLPTVRPRPMPSSSSIRLARPRRPNRPLRSRPARSSAHATKSRSYGGGVPSPLVAGPSPRVSAVLMTDMSAAGRGTARAERHGRNANGAAPAGTAPPARSAPVTA